MADRIAFISDEAGVEPGDIFGVAEELNVALEARRFWGKQPHELSGSEVDKVRELSEGLHVPIIGVATPIFKCGGSDSADRLDNKQAVRASTGRIERSLDIAKTWGAKFLRVFPGDLKEGISLESHRDVALKMFRAWGKPAKRSGIKLLIEMEASQICSNGKEVAGFLAELDDADTFGAVVDLANDVYAGNEDPIDGLTALMPWVGHVHIKDADLDSDGVPHCNLVGLGRVPLLNMVIRLLCAQYAGFFSIETHFRFPGDIAKSGGTKAVESEYHLPGSPEFSRAGDRPTQVCVQNFEVIFTAARAIVANIESDRMAYSAS